MNRIERINDSKDILVPPHKNRCTANSHLRSHQFLLAVIRHQFLLAVIRHELNIPADIKVDSRLHLILQTLRHLLLQTFQEVVPHLLDSTELWVNK
jgi:hypothetical protein